VSGQRQHSDSHITSHLECSVCTGLHFSEEKVEGKSSFNDCCSHGKCLLEESPVISEELQNLFMGSHRLSKQLHVSSITVNVFVIVLLVCLTQFCMVKS
jgi:hypothetical protein